MDFSTIKLIKDYIIKIFRLICFVFAVVCLIGGIVPLIFYFHLNSGNVALVIYGVLLLLVLFYKPEKFSKALYERIFKIGKAVIAILLAACFVLGAIISLFMIKYAFFNEPPENTGDKGTVVILGCKINGENPSRTLQGRLETGYEYLLENESAVVIVSGGQGWDEPVSEAYVMKKYLVQKGISEDRIYMEDNSINTDENIKFSGRIIKENNLPEKMYIITDTFHSCRAYMFAKQNGYEANNISADIYLPLFAEYWVRDILGIIHMKLTPNWELNIKNS